MTDIDQVEVLVIGSGAGGSVVAHELASRGYQVVVLEEGGAFEFEAYGQPAPEAMRRLYRRRGMTPVMGRVPIGYVEGCCVGGSTEINSGFWHRTPPEALLRWKSRYGLGATEQELAPHFDWAEEMLGVGLSQAPWPPSTRTFDEGARALGLGAFEVPRAAPGCQGTNSCGYGCPTGAKRGMSRSLLPRAVASGARIVSGARVVRLLHARGRVSGALIRARRGGEERLFRIRAEHVFVCCGPTETPSLLLRSGVRYHVGGTLRVHPYLKVAATFSDPMRSETSVLPLLQVREFWPELSLGGSFFGAGQLAMTLSDHFPEGRAALSDAPRMAQYYVGVRGTGRGWVRPTALGDDATLVRYDLSDADLRALSVGLARLSQLLLRAGAEALYPSVWGLGPIRSEEQAARWLTEALPKGALSLVTVHAFSSCPAGDHRALTAADDEGRVWGFENLRLADASVLPDSPGVNPQGTVMALARRTARAFAER
ncbi:MAG: GMC family oxidoreductase [Polyangiaceae bacterium]|nr:GMC family oxidoreductase [Polyangiaceae bacterium]MCW5791253.1 GMC family oxidoreductase [Polyangiaceae bacterium]